MNNIICLYHNDSDGRASAAVVDAALNNVYFLEIKYGYDWEDIKSTILNYKKLIIVDFSLRENEMKELLNEGIHITWIDHHESQIKNKYWADKFISGIRDITKSGCLLTWIYFKDDIQKETIHNNIPALIRYVNDYDLWKFEYGKLTLYLNESLRYLDFEHNPIKWNRLLFNDGIVQQYITEGKKFYERKEIQAQKLVQTGRFAKINNILFYCINSTDEVNLVADIAKQTKHTDNIAIYRIVEDRVVISLRGKEVNKVAEKYNGGGHKNAAGFSIPVDKLFKVIKWQ